MSDSAIEAARQAFVIALMTTEPGDEPYDFSTTLGEIEVYRLRRALQAAFDAFQKSQP